MTAVIKKSAGKGKTARARLNQCGCGYVDFAMRWPYHFLVMFDLPKEDQADSVDGPLGQNAFDVLMGCVLDAQKAGQLPGGDPLPQAWTAWSMVHGIAKLAVSGNLPMSRSATLEFARAATDALSRGMMR